MTHALFKQIDLTAKLGQDGSSLQALNALRVIRETVAKHLAGAEAAEEHPLERALLALHTIAEFPCPEQDNMPAANMRQIALAALDGAGASSEPGNPGGEPVSGPGNAGERPHPAPGSGDSELAESLQTLERWLDRVAIEDGYVGVPVIEAVEVAVNELRRLQAEVADWQEAAGRSRSDVMAYIAERAKLLEEHDVALAEVGALKAELQSQRERNTELIFKLGSATNGWGRCEKERDAALAEVELLRQFERICEGLPQDAIDGGWTVQGIRGYAKRLEDQLKAAQAEVEALRAELQSQRERNTELIFKLGSATNGWGRCEKERDAALARVAEFEAQAQHSVPEGWKLVPSDKGCVTSSMKAECIGEFSFYIRAACAECLDVGTDSDCHVCGGDIEYDQKIDVPWYTCKEIYKTMLAAAPGKAQHSVPEVSGIGRDFAYPRSVVLYLRTEPTDDDLRAIHDGLRSLAAAPGKEGV
ncbi:hypothetical protein ACT51Y_07260 [Pseudomonas aeruginosa]